MAHLPDLIGTFPRLNVDLQGTKGQVEVALVFVDVLQGFEIFVHTTEIWMDNNHSTEKNKHTKSWHNLTSSDKMGVEERSYCDTWWLNESTALPDAAAALGANTRCSTTSPPLICSRRTYRHTLITRIIS